ncbi:ran-binding protein 3-like isoform X4 [Odocoileus virginianus]|uniref:Ran-binding protein 3-like isoform X4 n=1 Tax=Odocoileus virginianus TaxID=9874 RepID=A0ABM4IXZ3_ODOVR
MSTTQRNGSSHLVNSLHTCRLKLPEEQQHQEKSIIAQPIFVFEKREQTFKRPAEDILYEAAECECNEFSRKRFRASSFTWHTTASQNQGVKKNNVFMTSNSVQRHADLNSAEQGPVKHSELVLRPAILQPPQAQGYIKVRKSFGHNVLESCKVKEKNKSKIYEGNSYLLSENLPSARISIQLSTNQNALGTTSLRCQPNEDKYSMKSCSSDFVFGENMVERVLGTQKLTQPQLESDLYIKEKPFKFTLKIPINSPNSRTDTIENISLIESATAFSFKPSPKCLLEKIDVITGEEAEYNVLEINCKLFIFNKTTQSWTERGRGALRLNDTASSDCGTFQSRLSRCQRHRTYACSHPSPSCCTSKLRQADRCKSN